MQISLIRHTLLLSKVRGGTHQDGTVFARVALRAIAVVVSLITAGLYANAAVHTQLLALLLTRIREVAIRPAERILANAFK